DAVHALVADACAQGATLACGGQAVDGAGWFYAPTVLTDVPAAARILHEEPFGPVALIARFTQIEQALAVANDTGYGLAAYAFSRDAHTLSLLASRLEAGMVALNSFVVSQPDAPFLGVKDSGHGAEAGSEGLEACLVTKLITQT
ncbi:MAG: aldehyde dehydrogenase family protein, partial [Burkholderiaceae bacterium]|nr:aldehyde dehydrogenase family protein [Burkholderiaceae bacterium]